MSNRRKIINLIVASAIFGALATILYCVPFLQFSLPFVPPFLKIHFEELPIMVAGYSFGPLVAFITIIISHGFKLIQDIPETGGIGVLADVIYTCALVLPAAFYYKFNRNLKGAVIGGVIGLFSQLIFSSVIGLYTIFPLYGFFYFPQAKNYFEAMEKIGALFTPLDNSITSATNPKIMYEFLLPFNLLKDSLVIVMTFIIYKPLKALIERKR